jgi:uncharacterized membrane protein
MNNFNERNSSISFTAILKNEWYIPALILFSLAFGLYMYPELPGKVPTHWNIRGEIDGWTVKSLWVWIFPLFNLGIYALLLLLPSIDPRKQNYAKFSGTYRIIRLVLVLFITLLYLVTIAVALGIPLKVDLLVKVSVSLLFVILGNYMGKVRQNYFVGFKTPWTLANEEVWRKTHRFAGPLWVVIGSIDVVLSFISAAWASITLFASFILMALIPLVYSYLEYRKIQ